MAEVGEMLERGVGVAIALEHDGLALIRVEEDFALERPVSMVRTISIACSVRRFHSSSLPGRNLTRAMPLISFIGGTSFLVWQLARGAQRCEHGC